MNEQKHYCVYCGKEAIHQFKNGKWCCSKTKQSCPANRNKISNKAKQKWDQLKQKGIKYRKDIPVQQQIKNKDVGQQHICFYCGSPAEYQLKNGRWCCHQRTNKCPAIRKKNSQKVKSLYSKNENGQVVFNGNLRKDEYTEQRRKKQGWSKGLTKYTNQSLKKRGKIVHQNYLKGNIIHHQLGKPHTDQWKDKMMATRSSNNYPLCTSDNSHGFKHGRYKGYDFDSSWELSYIMYNLDHNIYFQRNTKGFEYIFNGVKKRYYPDFILKDGTYIQIKGYFSQLTEQKIKQFPKNLTLKVLYKQDIDPYLLYVKEKYGDNFWIFNN